MKNVKALFFIFLLFNCTSADLINSWKNPEVDVYTPNKVLIVGLASNKEAIKKFENELKQEYERRGVEAVTGYVYFKSEAKTEEDLIEIEKQLAKDGFDTVLLSKVIGSDTKTRIAQSYKDIQGTYRDFKDEYYKYQNVINSPDYYENYQVYHAETSLYCICDEKARRLIWKGYIDITDPSSINSTISDYVNLVVLAMDELQLLNVVE